jgi:hypothetical protein
VAAALLAGGAAVARGQAPAAPEIVIAELNRERLAVPACIPRAADDASRVACRAVTDVLRRDLRFEGLLRFVEPSLMVALPAMDPDAPNLEDW